MADLKFPDDLAERLQQIAERENRSIPEVVRDMVDHQYTGDEPEETTDEDPFLRILEMAEEAKLTFTGNNVAERSREILNYEYADYLLKRMRGEYD